VSNRNRLGKLLLLPGSLWLLGLFLLPMVVVVVVAMSTNDIVGRPVYGVHWDSFNQAIQWIYLKCVLRSLLYAGLTTVVCLIVGYPVAYSIARFAGRWKNVLIGMIVVPWLVDYLVRIYAWVILLGNDGVFNSMLARLGFGGDPPVHMTNTSFAVIVGLTYNFLPLMILPLYANLEQMDPSLLEASKDLFATPRQTFVSVTLPTSVPGIVSGCLLVFLPSVGDFATVQFLGGASTYLVGNLISDQFRQFGNWPFGAALTVFLMVIMWTAIALYFLAMKDRAAEGLGVG
jgi:spermidine/putrescine transport system permease protein